MKGRIKIDVETNFIDVYVDVYSSQQCWPDGSDNESRIFMG